MRAPRILIIRLSAIGDALFTLLATQVHRSALPGCRDRLAGQDKAASVRGYGGWCYLLAHYAGSLASPALLDCPAPR
ncbi:MAG: hypothetical protein U1E76_05950 [Planctomycetota bacterium]